MALVVVLSLLLVTVSFRESPSGLLHDAQGIAAAALRPFQIGAERVARPFDDLYGWFSGLVHARSENERLRAENEQLRQQIVQQRTARDELARLRALLRYRGAPRFPADFDGVGADVIGQPANPFAQRITIAAGYDDGVRRDAPVVTGAGLVGRVTMVTRSTARVTLLTDEDSAVWSRDLQTGARGLVVNGRAGSPTLVLDRVPKSDDVRSGDEVITAGSQVGKLPSLYPQGIPIGRVTSVGQRDTDLYKRIQVEAHVDFDDLESVIVLVAKGRGAAGER